MPSGRIIPDSELDFRYVRASGPGGQNVNKVSTAVELRFDAATSPSLAGDVRARLLKLAGRRAGADGVILIDARRFRTQEANRRDAVARLEELVRAASVRPKARIATRPTRGSKERRIAGKRLRSGIKQGRGRVSGDD
jgi:ribosome-associated protein